MEDLKELLTYLEKNPANNNLRKINKKNLTKEEAAFEQGYRQAQLDQTEQFIYLIKQKIEEKYASQFNQAFKIVKHMTSSKEVQPNFQEKDFQLKELQSESLDKIELIDRQTDKVIYTHYAIGEIEDKTFISEIIEGFIVRQGDKKRFLKMFVKESNRNDNKK